MVARSRGMQLAAKQCDRLRVDHAERVVAQFRGTARKPRVASIPAGSSQGQVRMVRPGLDLETGLNQGAVQIRGQGQERIAVAFHSCPERAGMRGVTERPCPPQAEREGAVSARRPAHRFAHRIHAIVRHVAQEHEGQVRAGAACPRGARRLGAHLGHGAAHRGGQFRTGVDGDEEALRHPGAPSGWR